MHGRFSIIGGDVPGCPPPMSTPMMMLKDLRGLYIFLCPLRTTLSSVNRLSYVRHGTTSIVLQLAIIKHIDQFTSLFKTPHATLNNDLIVGKTWNVPPLDLCMETLNDMV